MDHKITEYEKGDSRNLLILSEKLLREKLVRYEFRHGTIFERIESFAETEADLKSCESTKMQTEDNYIASLKDSTDRLLNENDILRQKCDQIALENDTLLKRIEQMTIENLNNVNSSNREINELKKEILYINQEKEAERITFIKVKNQLDHTITMMGQSVYQAELEASNLRLENERLFSGLQSFKEKEIQSELSTASVFEKRDYQYLHEKCRILKTELERKVALLSRLDFSLKSTQEDNDNLLEKLKILQENFEKENETLKKELELLKAENLKLLHENEIVHNHQNIKQKIQYHSKIKHENNELREELKILRENLEKLHAHAVKTDSWINDLASILKDNSVKNEPFGIIQTWLVSHISETRPRLS